MFVLRKVSHALAYLHSLGPVSFHYEVSPNNVLLNVVSFVTKVNDFGMSRAINPSALSQKSYVKEHTGILMVPEALHDPPQYNKKLNFFSFSNILPTLTHEWPNPGLPN